MQPDPRTTSKVAGELTGALSDLADKQSVWEQAKRVEDTARRDTTSAVNALNTAQKRVDALTEELRRLGGGDWESNRRKWQNDD